MTFDTDAINNIKFTQGFRGYDTTEVDEFLDDMIREIEKLNNTIKNLKEEAAKEKRKNQLNQQEIDRLTEINEQLSAAADDAENKIEEPIAEPVETQSEPIKREEIEPEPEVSKKPVGIEDIKGTPEYDDLKRILTDTLFSAQQHAEKIVKDALRRADQLVEDGERRAHDRIVSLNADIKEGEQRLASIISIVAEAKQRYISDFNNQLIALDNIKVPQLNKGDKVEAPVEAAEPEIEKVQEKPQEKAAVKPEPEPKKEEVKEEKPTVAAEPKQQEFKFAKNENQQELSAFDFSAVKKTFASENRQNPVETTTEKKPEEKPAENKPASFDNTPSKQDENKQYIEVAMSSYNDNKHHNTDYPNVQRDIKISEDDEDGGIYQPENRSVLSSVIEEILNNKRDED